MRKIPFPHINKSRTPNSISPVNADQVGTDECHEYHDARQNVLAGAIGSNPDEGVTAAAIRLEVGDTSTDQACASDAIANSLPETAKKNPLGERISPFSTGLTIVRVRDESQIAHVRSVFTQLVLSGSKDLGVPMPEVQAARSLYAGNARRLEQAKILDMASDPLESRVRHDYEAVGSRDCVDWCSNEGLCILLPKISTDQGWLTVEQRIVGTPTPATLEGLFRIRSAAQHAGRWVMMFIVGQGDQEMSHLDQLSDEYVDVGSCEPDLGVDVAFSTDCFGIRYLNCLGIGRTMCSITLSEKGFQRRFEPFISHSLEDRVMWILRGQGKTFEEIGALLKKNKSSVLRRLQGLPKPRRVDLPADWLSSHLDMFHVSRCPKGSDTGDEALDEARASTHLT